MKRGFLRDLLILGIVFSVVLGGLYLYAGVWPPAVVVESKSMMHPEGEVSYGRFGTIDPGDLVLVKDVDGPDEVATLVEGGEERYGRPGEVLVFHPPGRQPSPPIIHRAVAYVEVAQEAGKPAYRVRWAEDAPCEGGAAKSGRWCVYGPSGITLPRVPIRDYRPSQGGFLTKGDNNPSIDQVSQISPSPVQMGWVVGVARGEVPWLGLMKLSLGDGYNQPDCAPAQVRFHFFSESFRCPGWIAFGHAYAPKDLWVMLGISLAVLVGGPLLWDLLRRARARRREAPPPPP